MSFDDLVQLLILAGIALAWLLGGSRTKRRPPEAPPKPPVRPQRQRPVETTTVVVQPGRTMAEELYRVLSGEVEQREIEEGESLEVMREEGESLEVMREEAAPVRPTLEEVHEEEAYSLETLEPAGEASHRRFHEAYVAPRQPAEAAVPVEPRRRARLSRSPKTVREAMIWREVLGPPKGLS